MAPLVPGNLFKWSSGFNSSKWAQLCGLWSVTLLARLTFSDPFSNILFIARPIKSFLDFLHSFYVSPNDPSYCEAVEVQKAASYVEELVAYISQNIHEELSGSNEKFSLSACAG